MFQILRFHSTHQHVPNLPTASVGPIRFGKGQRNHDARSITRTHPQNRLVVAIRGSSSDTEERAHALPRGGLNHAASRQQLGAHIGCLNTYIKDEGTNNATGSFKARGLSMAVSRAYELGAPAVCVPSAGNAAGATSAYAAAAGIEAHVYMPQDVPLVFRVECEQLGVHVTLVDGLINDCGK